MDKERQTFIDGTRRQALYLWIGLSLTLTLFFVQSQRFFVKGKPLPTEGIEWTFTAIGCVTFIFGLVFFKNYTKLRRKQIEKIPFSDRKQIILTAYVIQFVMFETLGLYGVLLSVLTQNTMKAVPFVAFAYLGFLISFPKVQQIKPFYRQPLKSEL